MELTPRIKEALKGLLKELKENGKVKECTLLVRRYGFTDIHSCNRFCAKAFPKIGSRLYHYDFNDAIQPCPCDIYDKDYIIERLTSILEINDNAVVHRVRL